MLAFIFFVTLCTPITFSLERISIKSALEIHEVTSEDSLVNIVLKQNIVYAQDGSDGGSFSSGGGGSFDTGGGVAGGVTGSGDGASGGSLSTGGSAAGGGVAGGGGGAGGGSPTSDKTTKGDSSGPDAFTTVMMWLGNALLGIGAFFAWVTGNFLDKILKELVFNMGGLINDGGIGIAIDAAWKVVRDLCNLAFIFGFIFLGIRTIIDPESSSVKRTLSQIIIGAFLINFSLYMAKFIIDFSNFAAYSIYNAMVSGGSSISSLMFDLLGVSTFYSTGNVNVDQFAAVTGGGMFAFYIMGLLLLLVAAFIFLASAILLVVRFVFLVFLMIGSPVLFAATVFPKTAGYASMLWGKLFSYSFFAPLYLLLTLISMMMLKGFVGVMSDGQQFASAFTDPNAQMDAFGVVVSFVVVSFFLIESLLISQKLGVAGADKAIGIGKNLRDQGRKMVGSATVGVAAYAGRNTVGRVSSRLERSTGFQRWAGNSKVGEIALKATRGVSNSSFDARNVAGAGEKLGIGKGSGEGGFNAEHKKRTDDRVKFGQSLNNDPDGTARTNYAKRLATSPLARHSVGGTMARHNRVAAARIFRERIAEISTEINQLVSQRNQINTSISSRVPPAATAAEAAELLDIDRKLNSPGGLYDERTNINNLTAPATPATPGGLNLRNTVRQDY